MPVDLGNRWMEKELDRVYRASGRCALGLVVAFAFVWIGLIQRFPATAGLLLVTVILTGLFVPIWLAVHYPLRRIRTKGGFAFAFILPTLLGMAFTWLGVRLVIAFTESLGSNY